MKNTVTEWCSNCDKEVELQIEFQIQKCTCGKDILPCAQCTSMKCENCPLQKEQGNSATIEFKEGRVIDESVKVFVYFNLHKNLFSVKALTGEHKGKVVAHMNELNLKDVSFRVSEAGRQRVLAEKRKNVHAGVVGYLNLTSFDSMDCAEEVTYNPYKHDSFVYKKDASKIKGASKAFLKAKKIFVEGRV